MLHRQSFYTEISSPNGKVRSVVYLEFHPTNPYAMQMIIPVGCEHDDESCTRKHEVEWEFSRDVVANALDSEERQGEGDVQAFKDFNSLVLFLSNPNGKTASIRFNLDAVDKFMAEVYRSTPIGTESIVVQRGLDTFLSELLAGE